MKQNFAISEDNVEKILNAHHLPQLLSLRTIKTGLTNPVFVINEQFVLRVRTNTSEKDASAFNRESFLYTVLAKHSIPVPTLIAFDESKIMLPYDFLLLSYIKGETLADSFDKQSIDNQKSLSFQLGEVARQVHSMSVDEIKKGEKLLRKKMSWQETAIDEFMQYFSLVKEKGHLSQRILNEIKEIFESFCDLDMPTKQERLVHGDFSPSNIQVNDRKIVGIFDFEFSTLGDPLYDLQKLPVRFQLGRHFDINSFLRGYGINHFNAQENIRLRMYCLSQGLWEIWATETQRFPFGKKQIAEGKVLIRKTLLFSDSFQN